MNAQAIARPAGTRVNTSNTDLYVVAAWCGLLLLALVIWSIWSRRFGIQAVQQWAAARGLTVVTASRRTLVPHWQSLSTNGRFQFFRVIVRNKDGSSYGAWMRLESYWTSPEVLEIIWDDEEPV